MRTASFIIAFVLLFLGPSMAGSSETPTLPGIGTFSFSGSLVAQAEEPIVMAALR